MTPNEVQIKFNMPDREVWTRYQTETSPNAAEYVWMVSFRLGDDICKAGYNLIKPRHAETVTKLPGTGFDIGKISLHYRGK